MVHRCGASSYPAPGFSGCLSASLCTQVGDLIDMHSYVGPNAPVPTATRAAVLGEFGGLGLRVDGHLWIPEDAFCYEMETNPAALEVLTPFFA